MDFENGYGSFKSLSGTGEQMNESYSYAIEPDVIQEAAWRSTRAASGMPPEWLNHEAFLARSLADLTNPMC